MPARGTQGILFSRIRFDGSPAIFDTPYLRVHAYALGETLRQVKFSQLLGTPFNSNSELGEIVVSATYPGGIPIGVPPEADYLIAYCLEPVHSINVELALSISDADESVNIQIVGNISANIYAEFELTGDTDYHVQELRLTPLMAGTKIQERETCCLMISTTAAAATASVKDIRLYGWDEIVLPGMHAGGGWFPV